MADCTVQNVSEKLIVGQLDMSFLTASALLTPGTAVINGPCYIGLTPQIGVARATCMIGPPIPGITLPVSLEVSGVTNFLGITNTTGVINDIAFSNIFGFTSKLGAEIQAAFKAIFGLKTNNSVQITNGPKVCSAVATTPLVKADVGVFGDINCAGKVTAPTFVGALNGVASGNKTLPFDIPHITQKGKRIRHICVEAPAADIYIRGTLVDSNVIELPEYWDGLIDPETITVSLTPRETYQELYFEKMEWGKKIIVKNNAGSRIHCDYQIWAARWINPMNHEEKLHVVYDGESPDDYPGNKESFLVGGWDYDRRETQWRKP